MATFIIESNGRIEKTAVYYNGEQIGGLREVLINLDEDGTFDVVISYEGVDGVERSKSIFDGTPEKIKFVEPSFTEDEAAELTKFVIDSDGDIDDTDLFINDEILDGVVSVYVHIKTEKAKKNGIAGIFKKAETTMSDFRSEITYRNEDDTTETERIF